MLHVKLPLVSSTMLAHWLQTQSGYTELLIEDDGSIKVKDCGRWSTPLPFVEVVANTNTRPF